jgi:hypothetical protein
VENRSAPSTSAGTCRLQYNADHLKTSGQRGSVSFLAQFSLLTYLVDNECVYTMHAFGTACMFAALSALLRKIYRITRQSAGNCLK